MSLDGHRPTRAPEWVSIHEAALLMGVSPATLRRWSDAGDIRTFTTPGGHRRFSLTAIAGLLPSIGPLPASRILVLDEVRQRTGRFVTWGLPRMARDRAWSPIVERRDLATLEADALLVVDRLLRAIDVPRIDGAGPDMAAAQTAAAALGESAGRRGVALGQLVEACLLLRRTLMRELSTAARRHDLDVSTTTRWLDACSHGFDALITEVMRGHERAGTSVTT